MELNEVDRVFYTNIREETIDNLILDEPTSGLDFKNMKEVSNEMMRLKEDGETIFIITHNPELVECCCDYFMFMENGKVKWHGIKYEKNMEKIREFFNQT